MLCVKLTNLTVADNWTSGSVKQKSPGSARVFECKISLHSGKKEGSNKFEISDVLFEVLLTSCYSALRGY